MLRFILSSLRCLSIQEHLSVDKYIKKQMKISPLLSYLLYENGKITIDEITPKERFGDRYLYVPAMSMATASSVLDLVGHAIQ